MDDKTTLIHGDDFVENTLEHYGILGMKWGVRRYQPYPNGKDGMYLGSKESRFNKKQDKWREKQRKKNIKEQSKTPETWDKVSYTPTVGSGSGTSFLGQDNSGDIKIVKGTTGYRLQQQDSLKKERDAIYASFEKADHLNYLKWKGENMDALEGDVLFNQNGNNGRPYSIKFQVSKDLIAPSYDKVMETFVETINNSKLADVFPYYVANKERIYKGERPHDVQTFLEGVQNIKLTEARDKAYMAFASNFMSDTPARNKFFKSLQDQGYSAIIDYHDKGINGKSSNYNMSEAPMIVFDQKNNLKQTGAKPISKEDANYFLNKHFGVTDEQLTKNIVGYIGAEKTKEWEEWMKHYYVVGQNGSDFLEHYGVLGMKWGIRRYQPYPDGKKGTYLGPEMKYKSPIAHQIKGTLKQIGRGTALTIIPGGIAVALVHNINVYRATHDKKDYVEKDGPVEEYKNMRKKTITTTADQDMESVNPKKGKIGRINNCTYCTAAMEMRRRGFDVEARRSGTGNSSDIWANWFDGAKVQQAYVKREQGESRKEWAQKNYKNLCNQLEKFPNGARGALGLTWSPKAGGTGSGHAIFWEVENGSVNFYDGQAGKKNDPLNFSLSNQVYTFARLDNCKLKNVNQAVISRKGK